MKELTRQGLGLRAVAKALTELGIPTKLRGKRWHPQMIRRILSDQDQAATTLFKIGDEIGGNEDL